MVAIHLFLSFSNDAAGINTAGAQRMLSQKVAKEALLAGQGLGSKDVVQATITQFESSCNSISPTICTSHKILSCEGSIEF